MKRAEPPSDGPSGQDSLLPRDAPDASQKKQGGRGIKNRDCWKQGASKGSVMIFLSTKNKKGEKLEEGKYRCILHEHEAEETIVSKGENKGEWNLKQQLSILHQHSCRQRSGSPVCGRSRVSGYEAFLSG